MSPLNTKFYSIFLCCLVWLSFEGSAFGKSICSTYLSPVPQDIIDPLLRAKSKLKLVSGLGRLESNFKGHFTEELLKSLSFFRSSLEQLHGGKDLFLIFETIDQFSEEDVKRNLNLWAKTYFPGYEIIFFEDVQKFKFKNSTNLSDLLIYDPETGSLDDKYLFELYANKKIPILKITDLVSKILILAAPQLRQEFEKLVDLYQRALALGDKTELDLLMSFSNLNATQPKNYRLSFISAVMELLISKLVFFGTQDSSKQLVLFGTDNLIASISLRHSLDLTTLPVLKQALDLSLVSRPSALSYFMDQAQSKNPLVLEFFEFLVRANIVSNPAMDHFRQPEITQKSLLEKLHHFDVLSIESNLSRGSSENFDDTPWTVFSNIVYTDRSSAIQQISNYGFRFQWLKFYIQIVERDLILSESQN